MYALSRAPHVRSNADSSPITVKVNETKENGPGKMRRPLEG